jgi:hypothetical protein
MSNGEIVPEVMTTLLNLSKTGLMASAGSRHLKFLEIGSDCWIAPNENIAHVKWKMGFGTVAASVS